MTEHWDTIATERRALADIWDGFTAEQWSTQSLCPAWTVHGVACHLVSVLEADKRTMAASFVHGRGLPSRAANWMADGLSGWSGAQLAEGLRRHADSHFAPVGLGSRSSLTDVMVHRVDIVVPLGLPVDRPAEHWRPVLDFLLGRIPMLGMIKTGRPALSYQATDLGWQRGSGPEVRGPAAVLGSVVAGRAALSDRLEGPGADTLAAWARG